MSDRPAGLAWEGRKGLWGAHSALNEGGAGNDQAKVSEQERSRQVPRVLRAPRKWHTHSIQRRTGTGRKHAMGRKAKPPGRGGLGRPGSSGVTDGMLRRGWRGRWPEWR